MASATATNVLFPWREVYSVGLPEIDQQHKLLIRLINNLQDAMMEGKGKLVLSTILSDLIRYTESHFSFEEEMLRKRGYPGLAAHQQQHRALTRRVHEISGRFQSGELVITMEVMRFLKDWLANHILDRDQAYAKELKLR